MINEDRVVMTGVTIQFDRGAAAWVASCDDPAGEERLVVHGKTREQAERLLDERWRARLEGLDREAEEER